MFNAVICPAYDGFAAFGRTQFQAIQFVVAFMSRVECKPFAIFIKKYLEIKFLYRTKWYSPCEKG